MAQPVNSFDSYDAVGIKEDLQDVIYDISPDETPFFTKCAKIKARNTFHEWQTDALRSSTDNAHIEGDDTVADAVTPTVRLGNYTQIFKNAVVMPDTDMATDKAGRATDMARAVLRKAREQKLDIEKALFANQARSAGSSVAPRRMAGAPSWIATNTNLQSGNGGADPTGDGTDARTDDGTPDPFSQTKMEDVMEKIWVSGGRPDTVYVSPFQMRAVLSFTGANNQRSSVTASLTGRNPVIDVVDVYVTPWGTVEFEMSRECRPRDVFVMQSDMWAVGVLRPTKTVSLAKSGDNEKRQIVTELTLCAKNEAASGIVADCTTS